MDTLLQDYRTGAMSGLGQRFKKMVYKYDLVSGKVNHVAYQPGQKDQFYHRYIYDADNRLTQVMTSADSLVWERDASYSYLLHGPLGRTVLGQQKVQGQDYVYTLQGWLKAINASPTSWEVGNDGYTGFPNVGVARDAYSLTLHYNRYDHANVLSTCNCGVEAPLVLGTEFRDLYNGNIAGMSVSIPKINYPVSNPASYNGMMYYNYRYDQLNRITGMNAYTNFFVPSRVWTVNMVALNDYREKISYDANGNILNYLRNGTVLNSSPLAMDSLSYKYYPGTNRLRQVRDSVNAANYTEDIDNQADMDNYVYDDIGNLIEDKAEGIDEIQWNVYGKIATIEKVNGMTIRYTYDAAGNRISKKVLQDSDSTTTWYVRDATGNVMSVYKIKDDTARQEEIHLYGSSRLGITKPERILNLDAQSGDTSGIISLLGSWKGRVFRRGLKFFELTNHLGSVLVTISDKKIGVDGNSDGVIDYYNADVITANDMYPFGSTLPGRSYGTQGRYGFNGKEDDRDITVGAQDYGLRIYDKRLGRFLSVDPLMASYSFYTPYQFAGNTPIQFIDLDGGEPKSKTSTNPEVRKLFVSPFGKYAARLSFIHGPYWATGGDKSYFNKSETESKGYYTQNVDQTLFFAYKQHVNTTSQFYMTDESMSESALVNNILGDFVWGNGPENTVFKHGGKYSNLMKESVAVGETLAKFSYDLDNGSGFGMQETYPWSNDLRGEINTNVASGILSLAHLLGSCQIRVSSFQNSDNIMVEVFNVTSLTSGDFLKDVTPNFLVTPLKSTKRNGKTNGSQMEYSNISQYFSFTLTRKEFDDRVRQYQNSKEAYKQKKEKEKNED